MLYNIGIIGKGFVGSAVQYGFSNFGNNKFKIRIFDVKQELSTSSFEDTVNLSDIIFISVPTPSNVNGSINLDIVNNLFRDIENIYNGKAIILLRSTVIPGTTANLQEKYTKLKIVFNPEFLTEANANKDFINQDRIILGGESDNLNYVEKFYRKRFGNLIQIIKTNYQTAEIIKYMNNCFLATKVSFMNEMKQLSENSSVDWDKAVDGFLLDSRIGKSHYSVPGPDGKPGFGGSCFPKDVRAILHYAESININLQTLEGAWKTNLKVRSEKDWEKLEGRAVIKKK